MLNVPRNISFVGKAEYMDSWKTKYLFPAMGMIPIDRSGGDKRQAALDAAEAVLRRGELFGIFPEGTRSRDGVLHKGRTGAARLALKVGCPIFPVGIIGHRRDPAARRQGAEAATGRARSRSVGRSEPERYAAAADATWCCGAITDEVMFEIRELTGQATSTPTPGRTPRRVRRCAPRPARCTSARRSIGPASRPAPTTACSSARRADHGHRRRNRRGSRRGDFVDFGP